MGAPASPSSRGPGHRPFTAVTRVRIPVGTPLSACYAPWMPGWFAALTVAVAALAGAVAAVAGTGVGSLLTPALSLEMDIRVAVLAVTAPHIVFNAMRCWSVRSHLDRG